MTTNPNDDANNSPASGNDPFSSFDPKDYVKKHKTPLYSSLDDEGDDDEERRPSLEHEYMREREMEEEGGLGFEGSGEEMGEGLFGALGFLGRRGGGGEGGGERGKSGGEGRNGDLLIGGMTLFGLLFRIAFALFGMGFCCALLLFILLSRR